MGAVSQAETFSLDAFKITKYNRVQEKKKNTVLETQKPEQVFFLLSSTF